MTTSENSHDEPSVEMTTETISISTEMTPEIAAEMDAQRRAKNRARLSQQFKRDRATATPLDDPMAVPAFETAAGLAQHPNEKPVVVNAMALENFNRNVSPAVLKHQIEAANVAAMFSKRAIRPDEIAALRRRMFNVVDTSLRDVEEVLSGQKQWNNAQVRLFSILTERVMPKLTSITVDDNSSKKLEDMSLEELEEIAMGKKKATAVDAIVKQGQELEAGAEALEAREFNATKDREIAGMAALAKAEQEFVAGKLNPKLPVNKAVEVAKRGGSKKGSSTPTPTTRRSKRT